MPAKAFVVLTLQFQKEDSYWTGECVELGTTTDGRSLPRVEQELRELVLLHLNTLEKNGERERFFQKHGIKMYTDEAPSEVQPRVPVSTTRDHTFTQFPRIEVEPVLAYA